VAGLKRHNFGVDGHAQRDADPAQAHDRGRDAEEPHPGEGQEEDQRQRQKRHQRARCVEEKQEDDQHHYRDLFRQSAQQRVLDAVGEVQSVVDSHDLDASRQPRAQLCQRTLDPLDNGLRIGVATGDHDSADGRMSAVEVRDPRRHVGSDGDVADISDLQPRILRRLGPWDWLRILWPDGTDA